MKIMITHSCLSVSEDSCNGDDSVMGVSGSLITVVLEMPLSSSLGLHTTIAYMKFSV